ncbi:MAG: methyl-accepting chemotaxis protein [Proteobacteria bacterium]|nr:methyl-accepting chemotaxis protein [Pseudomonadota bacterium]
MNKLTIAHRIMLQIGFSIASLLLVGSVGLYVSKTQTEDIRLIDEDSLAGITTLTEARQAFMMIRLSVLNHVGNPDPAGKKAAEEKIALYETAASKRLKDYEKLISNEEEKKLLETDVSRFNAYLSLIHDKVLPLSRNNQNDTDENRKQGAEINARAFQALEDHIAFNNKSAGELTQAALASAAQGMKITLTAIAIALLVVAVIGLTVAREIRFRMNRFRDTISGVAESLDFTVRIPIKRLDELGLSADAFNKLLDRLQGNLKSIAAGAASVATAAHAMATTANQVATASNQQSEAASNMAATVEQMTVSINHVADRAQEANRLSSESGQLAVSGEAVIGQTAGDIHDIAATVDQAAGLIHGLEQHSQQIANVVQVIKDVADQTNLLALNAAIEAARAGEQGRGFAVVADEVRKLAERTSASTQEIATTIDTMRSGAANAVTSMHGVVTQVAQGVERAQQANESIKQIGQSSRNAVGMVEEIAEAIREQSSATDNIATQVERIAQMSEESSAAVGNSAESAQQLDRLATDMQHIVAAYRL